MAIHTFRWLHLTDLHLGMSSQASLWPNVEEMFLEDLSFLRKQVGPWDMVLFTGDLTQRGTKPEFDEVDKLLQKFWLRFKELEFTPKLLAIPGNHDLVRPEDETDPALITLLKNWNLAEVQKPFWHRADSPQRVLISTVFQNFSYWWEHTPIPKPAIFNSGLLPGDCSASCEVGDFKFGIVGLNSAYLQLTNGNFEKKLNLDVRQFQAVCNSNSAEWTKQHDLCLLLTHHPVTWLSEEAQKHFSDEIHFPPERFALHLFGHMHEANLKTISYGGGSERRQHQGCSLFSIKPWGEKGEKRNHGYSLCELKLEENEIRLRIWPRRVIEKQGGGRKLSRDESFDLDERDGGTMPVVVKRLDRKPIVVLDRTTAEVTPPEASISYDPRNIPFFIPYKPKGDQVIGRDMALNKVRQQLTSGRRTAIGQTAVFQGLGGLGKTQVAVEYAYTYRDAYPNGVIWLTADQDLDAQLVDLAVKAHWVAPASEHSLKLEIALHRLRSYSGCLVIFDNLEQLSTITGYLPYPAAEPHILVTSRIEQPDFTYLPIDLLDPDQSLLMLTQEAGRQPEDNANRKAALEIVRILGGLPLALELAGAYLSRRPVSWQEYLTLLQHNLKKALPPRLASLTRHEADLYSTLQVSESVFAEEPQLQDILDVLTWSGPAPMGSDLIATLVGTTDRVELTNALSLGTALRILQRVPETSSYALHRLVREVRREQKPLADRHTWAADLCQRIGDWFDALRRDFVQLPRFEAEIDHLREWHDHSLKIAPQHASRLTWLQAYPPFHRGQFREIKRLVEISLIEYDQQGCHDRSLLAHLDNDLAYSLNALGNPKRALELVEQALAIWRELFGDRHTDTALSLYNVANYTDALGNPKRALELAEQALAIRQEVFGDRHPDTAASLESIASYTNALGNPKHALELAEQVLAIRQEVFGNRHPATANSLNNIASYTDALGNSKRALELAEQALAIRQEVFGDRHPATAASLNNIAHYTNAQGNPKRALEIAEQALTIWREVFGDRHTDTAASIESVASYTNALGNPKRALELAEQALAIRQEVFGDRHPAIAASLNNIANYNSALGNPKRALELAEQALAIQRELFGERHPDTAAALNNIANYNGALGNPKLAFGLAEQALAIRQELFGDRHPATASSLHGTAFYLMMNGKTQQAYDFAKKAFEIKKDIFGSQHTSTLNTAKLLAKIRRPGFRVPSTKKTGNKNRGKNRR